MGFFKGIKDKLGIQGVSLEIRVLGHVNREEDVEGTLVLTTKSQQEIIDIKMQVYEEFTAGRGDEKKTSQFKLGELNLPDQFQIDPGETKEILFTIPFQASKSENTSMAEKGGAIGALGKLAKFASAETSSYYVKADVDVKSAFLDPSEKVEIKLT